MPGARPDVNTGDLLHGQAALAGSSSSSRRGKGASSWLPLALSLGAGGGPACHVIARGGLEEPAGKSAKAAGEALFQGLRRYCEHPMIEVKQSSHMEGLSVGRRWAAGGLAGRGLGRSVQHGSERRGSACELPKGTKEWGPSILRLSHVLGCDGRHVGRVRQFCLVLVRLRELHDRQDQRNTLFVLRPKPGHGRGPCRRATVLSSGRIVSCRSAEGAGMW